MTPSPELWRQHLLKSKGLVAVPKERVTTRATLAKGEGIRRVAEKWIRLWQETCPAEVEAWKQWQDTLKKLLEAEYGDLANLPKAREISLATNFPVFVLKGIGRPPPQGIGDPNWHLNDPEAYDTVCKMIPECMFTKGSVYVRK